MKKLICIIAVLTAVSCLTLFAGTNYVWKGSPSPSTPYDSWATAAHTIQDAVDVAYAWDTVLVTNGIYDTGGRAKSGSTLSNRVLVVKGITIKSVNGPEQTIILGEGPLGGSAVRCILIDKAVISGFTLSNGHTQAEASINGEGGGAYGYSTATITNCIIYMSKAYRAEQ